MSTRPFVFASPLAQNRARALASRILPDRRSWLDLVGLLCLDEGVQLEQVLVDERPPAARRVLARAWDALRRLSGRSEIEIAEAFGIHNGWEGAARERAAGGSG